MTLKKLLFLAAVSVFTVGLFAGGSSEADTPAAGESEMTKKLTVFSDANTASRSKPIVAAFKELTGIEVEYQVVPGQASEIYQKIDISLMSGEKTDLIHCNSNYFNKVGRAELGLKLNSYIDNDADYDAEKTAGDYLQTYHNGGIYGLPISSTLWAVFYNKKIFDEAGVSYPDGTWTWDEYIAIAKKLNNPDKQIMGSYMPKYDNVFHIKANMKGVSAYTSDGKSNFKDPVFAEGIKWYNDLSKVHKIQPSWTEQVLKKLGSFHFLGGKNGMMLISSWYLSPITDLEKYPRDWEIGITNVPKFSDVKNNKNFGSTGFLVVNKNSENPDAAYEYAKFYSQNNHKYTNVFPALAEISKQEMQKTFENIENDTNGEITVEDLFKAYFDNGLGFNNEKLGGVIGNEYSNLLKQEGELYVVETNSLEETVDNITERANSAIDKIK